MGAHKGSRHHKAKLNEGLVIKIRKRYASGQTLTQIQEWLVSQEVEVESVYGTLGPIVRRTAWRHVP